MTGVRDAARRYLAGGGCGDMDLLDALPTGDGLRAEVEAEGARRRAELAAERAAELATHERAVAAYEAGGPTPGGVAWMPFALRRRVRAATAQRAMASDGR